MNTAEITQSLKEFAIEDTGYAMESGSMAITDTKKGLITLNFEENKFQSLNIKGEALTGFMSRGKMIDWLINQYVVEIQG